MRQRHLAMQPGNGHSSRKEPDRALQGVNDTLAQLLMVMEKLDNVIGKWQPYDTAGAIKIYTHPSISNRTRSRILPFLTVILHNSKVTCALKKVHFYDPPLLPVIRCLLRKDCTWMSLYHCIIEVKYQFTL